ncbi:MAG: YicC family protein, partial [Rhodocyclaceae bacterium]
MTIQSMTGYAALDRDLGPVRLALELKSVNGRFLDLNFRCAEELRFLEMPLRERLTAAIGRGKVDCRLTLQPNSTATPHLVVNAPWVHQLAVLEAEVRRVLATAAPLSVADVLRWPGVLASESIPPERLQAECFSLLDAVLAEFLESRKREGGRLAEVLRGHIARMRAEIAKVEPLVPAAIVDYTERLASRLREAVAALDEERIRQEIGVF